MKSPPKPGSPEFLAMIEREKDYIEQQTGIRPAFILDIGVGDIPGYGDPIGDDQSAPSDCASATRKPAAKRGRKKRR